MTATAHVVHRSRHRLRLRVLEKREEPEYFDRAQQAVAQLPGVATVRTNSRTGSILIECPNLPLDDLLADLDTITLFRLETEPEPAASALAPVEAAITAFNRALQKRSAGGADLRTLVFVGLVALAIRQILRGEVMGPALPLLGMALALVNDKKPADGEKPINTD